MNALANALAHGRVNAMRPTSVHAKTRDLTTRDLTTRDHTTPHLNRSTGSRWSVDVETKSKSFSDVTHDTADVLDLAARRNGGTR